MVADPCYCFLAVYFAVEAGPVPYVQRLCALLRNGFLCPIAPHNTPTMDTQ
jgi:hypothetical protein